MIHTIQATMSTITTDVLTPYTNLSTTSTQRYVVTSDNVTTTTIMVTDHVATTYKSLRTDFNPDQRTSKFSPSNYLWILAVLVVICAIIGYVMWSRMRHYRYEKLQRLLDDEHIAPYIYKPLQGGSLDEQYENTFVGVSVPLLQDNTKV